MGYRQFLKPLAVLGLVFLSACSSVVAVSVSEPFPDVVYEPADYRVALVFDPEFSAYVANPNENTSINIGGSQVE